MQLVIVDFYDSEADSLASIVLDKQTQDVVDGKLDIKPAIQTDPFVAKVTDQIWEEIKARAKPPRPSQDRTFQRPSKEISAENPDARTTVRWSIVSFPKSSRDASYSMPEIKSPMVEIQDVEDISELVGSKTDDENVSQITPSQKSAVVTDLQYESDSSENASQTMQSPYYTASSELKDTFDGKEGTVSGNIEDAVKAEDTQAIADFQEDSKMLKVPDTIQEVAKESKDQDIITETKLAEEKEKEVKGREVKEKEAEEQEKEAEEDSKVAAQISYEEDQDIITEKQAEEDSEVDFKVTPFENDSDNPIAVPSSEVSFESSNSVQIEASTDTMSTQNAAEEISRQLKNESTLNQTMLNQSSKESIESIVKNPEEPASPSGSMRIGTGQTKKGKTHS